jgi:steroid 5-alpha reductase family enzyme
MIDLSAWFISLAAIMALAVAAWLFSLKRRDVGLVDSLWSLFFLLGLAVYVALTDGAGWRAPLLLALVAIWALRLSIHITVRNHGKPEDRRYQAIRKNNEPNFEIKSLYIVFLLQGFLAWVVGLPLIAAVNGQTPPGPLDFIGVGLWLVGMFFEVVADYQLMRFRKSAKSEGAVLDTGLWRYSRHPNYFGEAVLWWGFYLIALAAGAWWTVFAPLLMTFLLLRVSGVSLLEKDIGERRPAYRDYVQRTNAFIPGLPR